MRINLGVILLGVFACAETPATLPAFSEDPLYVVAVGTGEPPLVVLHGGPGLRHNYLRPELDAFAALRRVVYYDQRGCGLSTSEGSFSWEQHVTDLYELITSTLRVDRVALMGSSWGAILALLFAGRHPELVTSVVSSGLPWWPDSAVYRRRAVIADSLRRAVRAFIGEGGPDTQPAAPAISFRERRIDSAAVAEGQAWQFGPVLAARLGESCLGVWEGVFSSFVSVPDVDWLASLPMPVLLIYGAEGPDGEAAQKVRSILPRGEVAVVSNAGHDPWFDVPDRFVETVELFFSKVSSPLRR